jgi:GNAT superfamily N-acetyltransferase
MKANEFINEDWNKVNKKDKTDGLSQKAVNAYRRENPGSKLKTAVTTKPSKLKAGSKDAKRRKSFCARMSGNKGPMKKPNGKPTPKALALRRWNCESVEQMAQLIESAQREIIEEKIKQRLDPKCWKGKHKEGTKIKGGIRVNNCVPNESVTHNIAEKINPETLKRFFKKEKDLGWYKLEAAGDLKSRMADDPPTLTIRAFLTDSGAEIGELHLKIAAHDYLKNNPGAEALVAAGVDVDPEYQRKGVASAMYQFAKELGNDVIASFDQSDDAKAMWTGMNKKSSLAEKWTQKYKSSINCSNPKGFSQKAHCAGKKKK